MKKKNLAFTLAEVLIVIGIIGVVAALTLPNLNHATGDKERITKVKKIYSTLTEAFDRAQAIYGDYDTWFIGISTQNEKIQRFAKRVTEFIKISKDCGLEKYQGCFSKESYTNKDGSSWGYSSLDAYTSNGGASNYKVVTSDNMSISFMIDGSRGYIDVDIDGPQRGLNRGGYDLFRFDIDNNNISPKDNEGNIYGPYGSFENYIKGQVFLSGFRGAYWIIEFDNADYLKADSTGKCNDSDIVLDWTTNTSCH